MLPLLGLPCSPRLMTGISRPGGADAPAAGCRLSEGRGGGGGDGGGRGGATGQVEEGGGGGREESSSSCPPPLRSSIRGYKVRGGHPGCVGWKGRELVTFVYRELADHITAWNWT